MLTFRKTSLNDLLILSHFSGHKQEEGGYVCPSDIFYGRPQRAVNTWGHWKVQCALCNNDLLQNTYLHFSSYQLSQVIVNLPDRYGVQSKYGKYTQTTR